MAELSKEAQAVLDATFTLADNLDRDVTETEIIAAALRAAADQVVPANVDYFKSLNVRRNLLAIADELEAQ
jgi:hypothetical protein